MNPTANLSVMAIPPQMMDLLSLLGLQGEGQGQVRADMKLAAMLPDMTPDAYLKATLAASAPNIQLPAILPPGGGATMSLMMKIAAVAPVFPAMNPRNLVAQVHQAALSLAANVLPPAQSLQAIPPMQMQNMTMAAVMTLSLRAKGVCPMALANVDVSLAAQAGVTDSRGTCSAALAFAATLPKIKLPPLAMPLPKIQLAQQLAVLAPAAAAPPAMGLPPITDPNLTRMLMSQLAGLATVPVPNLPVSLEELEALAARLQDLAMIQEAFGPGAMTPAGVARVNAMLQYMAKLNVPLPIEAKDLKYQLNMLPKIDDVTQGAQAAKNGAINMAASMSVQPPAVPILPVLEKISELAKVLEKALGQNPLGPCGACNFEIGGIEASLANMSLPAPPPVPALPI
ncbi:MAG: hypothetical protein AAF408_09045 [Pseudomonadota bacterium]